MATAPRLTIVTFPDSPTVRAFDIPTPLATGLYCGSTAEEEALDEHGRWLIFHLNAMFGVKRFWLATRQPNGLVPDRLLVELDDGYRWDELQERLLDRLARHFDWSHLDLHRHLKRSESSQDPLQDVQTTSA